MRARLQRRSADLIPLGLASGNKPPTVASVSFISVVTALCAISASSGSAAANPDLDRARELKSQLRYAEAATAVDAAIGRGGASPEQLGQMWRLAGELAAGLGRRDDAIERFARWLAIAPSGELGTGVSPKLAEPFVAARARLAGQRISIAPTVSGRAVTLTLADPLTMAAELRLERSGGEILASRSAASISITVAGTAPVSLVATAFDRFGNVLVRVSSIQVNGVASTARPPWRRPLYWFVALRSPVWWG